jgi:NAD(P)H dehydrogenase (quinone)
LIAEGVTQAGKLDARLMEVDKIDRSFLSASNAVIFGSPTYSAHFAWPLKRWFDEDARDCHLAGKLAGNFATGAVIGGGESVALSSMASHELVRGMMVYSGGGPLTHLGAVVVDLNDPSQRARTIAFGKRIGDKAIELFGK